MCVGRYDWNSSDCVTLELTEYIHCERSTSRCIHSLRFLHTYFIIEKQYDCMFRFINIITINKYIKFKNQFMMNSCRLLCLSLQSAMGDQGAVLTFNGYKKDYWARWQLFLVYWTLGRSEGKNIKIFCVRDTLLKLDKVSLIIRQLIPCRARVLTFRQFDVDSFC